MASASTALVGAMLDYYGNLTTEALKRWNTASQKISDGTYTPGNLFSDVMYLWLQGATGWMGIPLAQSGSIPTAFLTVKADAKAGGGATVLKVVAPGTDAPDKTPLGRLGGTETIAKESVVADLDASRTKLSVDLKNLGGKMTPGVYQGLVTLGQSPLAVVVVNVVA